MASNYGKEFEKKFQQDWLKSFPNTFLLRLPDQQSGYFGTSKNICDFIAFNNKTLYLLECKSHRGASVPFDAISQYDRLIHYDGYDGIKVGVIAWLIDKDKVFYIPISTLKKMKNDGKKSVGLKSVDDGYDILELPSVKKRVFLDTDYSLIKEYKND